MPRSSLLFVVPDDPSAIADVLADHGVDEGVGGCTDAEEIADFLSGRAGTLAEAFFDLDDPQDPITEAAAALEAAGVPYWGVHDAFEERSRGIRVLGRAYVNLTGVAGDRRELTVPWEHGEPAMDERTLQAGGMARAEADAVCARFFSRPAPVRAPGR